MVTLFLCFSCLPICDFWPGHALYTLCAYAALFATLILKSDQLKLQPAKKNKHNKGTEVIQKSIFILFVQCIGFSIYILNIFTIIIHLCSNFSSCACLCFIATNCSRIANDESIIHKSNLSSLLLNKSFRLTNYWLVDFPGLLLLSTRYFRGVTTV